MNPDDSKFTAHILGELDGLTAAERAEIEALIRTDAGAAAEAAETQAVAALLRRELQGEEAQPLTPEQRAAVLAATASASRKKRAKVIPFPRRLIWLPAIAACLIVGISVALIFRAMETDKTAGRQSLAGNRAQSGPTITLDTPTARPEPPPAAPQVPAAVGSEAVAAAGLNLPESKDLLANVPRGAERPMSPPKVAAPAPAPILAEMARSSAAVPEAAPPSADGARVAAVQSAPPKFAGAAAPLPEAASPGIAAGAAEAVAPTRAGEALAKSESLSLRGAPPPAPGRQAGSAEKRSAEATPDSPFLNVRQNPVSTFSIDVGTASYGTVREFLHASQLPPRNAVRIEELLNHFTYGYPQPQGDAAFSTTMEAATCPWNPAHRLVRIGIKGREVAQDKVATIAKDVKIQVAFNPAQVTGYRLIGYEVSERFSGGKSGAGEVVAGRSVTALYEVVPAEPDGAAFASAAAATQKSAKPNPLLTLKLRYKAPVTDTAKLLELPLSDTGTTWEKSSRDFRFAAAVAGFGMLLRDSPHKGTATWSSVHALAVAGKGEDASGARADFIALIEMARALQRR